MWYIIAAVTAIILIAAFLPVRVIFSYHTAGETRLSIKIAFFKISFLPVKKKNHKKKQKKKAEKNTPTPNKKNSSNTNKIRQVLDLYDKFAEDFGALLDYTSRKSVSFEQLTLHIRYSTGDAAATGILCGMINSVVYSLLGIIHQRAQLENPDIIIQPEFDDAHFIAESECILRLKNVHIIVIAVKVLLLIRRIKRHLRSKNASEK